MIDRASDTVELERLLNAAENEEYLNEMAIQIFDRLRQEGSVLNSFGSLQLMVLHNDEVNDFERVIADIKKRRRDGVLLRYELHKQCVNNSLP